MNRYDLQLSRSGLAAETPLVDRKSLSASRIVERASSMSPLSNEICVTRSVRIPRSELSFQFSRSGGPGGQNVNKLNTRVQMRWNVDSTGSVSDAVRERLLARARRRINSEGELIITSQRFRDQAKNIDDCIEKLSELIRECTAVPRTRKQTRPSKASKRRRLEAKKQHSQRKQARRRPRLDES
jgi:ribosome-associated protein